MPRPTKVFGGRAVARARATDTPLRLIHDDLGHTSFADFAFYSPRRRNCLSRTRANGARMHIKEAVAGVKAEQLVTSEPKASIHGALCWVPVGSWTFLVATGACLFSDHVLRRGAWRVAAPWASAGPRA